MGWSALEDRDTGLGLDTRLICRGLESDLSGVEEANGASLSARSLELILSVGAEREEVTAVHDVLLRWTN